MFYGLVAQQVEQQAVQVWDTLPVPRT